MIFSVQETKFWNLELELPGYVCYGSNSGLATLVLSDLFSSKLIEERWTAFLFESVMVMAVYAPNCKKEFDGHERFKKKGTNVLRDGRRPGAKEFDITGDFNVEPGLLCTDEDDNEELSEMYKPPCWQG